MDGDSVGILVGESDGFTVGCSDDGIEVGSRVGCNDDGKNVGFSDGA